MAYRLKWSDQSLQDLINIKSHLIFYFGFKSWLKFLKKFARHANRVAHNPQSFQIFPGYTNIRKCTVSNRCAIFFMIKEDEVLILTLFDMRQNPERLKQLLEE